MHCLMMCKKRCIRGIFLEEINNINNINNMKLCLIYNFAQHYRTSIFKRIDEEFDCDYLFGDNHGDIELMDYSLLRGFVQETHTKRLGGGWYYQDGVPSLLLKNYDRYILLGETRALSTWLFLLMSKFFPKKKVYLWSHGWYGKETQVERVIKKVFFKLPNGGIFLYGDYARRLMISEGFNPNKLYVIHNSLAYDKQIQIRNRIHNSSIYREHFGNNYPTLIFIGRLTKVKKLHQLIEMLEVLNNRSLHFNLVLVGDGTEKEALEILVNERGLAKQVWFYGSCYDEQKNAELIYNADLCVAPGNVGLTAMHVMVFGTPVVTHDDFSYQMPEFEAITSGVTGGFFRKDSIDSMADCVEQWFNTRNNCREDVRKSCYNEIDKNWTPEFQINVFKNYLK